MNKRPLPILLCLLLIFPLAAREPAAGAGPRTESQWLTVLLAGRKVGHARIESETSDDKVVTRQHMHFEMGRAGIKVQMSTFESHEETPAGEPLAFTSTSTISGLQMRVEGRRVAAGRFAVRSGAAGALRDSELRWPEGAVLAHGMNLKLRKLGTEPGTQTRFLLFQPLLQDAVNIDYEVIGPATVDLPSGSRELLETRQVIAMPGGGMDSRSWMDGDLNVQRTTLDVLGQTLELLACDQACAEAPNQPAEILTISLVRSPRALKSAELLQPLTLELHSPVPLADWPGVDGQRLRSLGDKRYRLDTFSANGDAMAAPREQDLERTDWLDYDSPAVQDLLVELDHQGDPAARMQVLQDRVSRHIRIKNLRVGYASASDAARLGEGDCTEHALLLAALGRASGVPTRVVNGLAYTNDFDGQSAVFVPHAWVAAWTGERWQAFDAALPGRQQLRLAIHADNGDPWRFYDGLNVFGQLRIMTIRARAS